MIKKNIYTIWEYTVYQNVSWILLLHLNLSFLSLPWIIILNCLMAHVTPLLKITDCTAVYVLRCFEFEKDCRSDMHFVSHLTTLPIQPTHNTSTIFLILIQRNVTYFDTSVSYILQVLIIWCRFYETVRPSGKWCERNHFVQNLHQWF